MNPALPSDMFALYVHWPFCKAKCPYCDFNSHVRAGVDQARWRQALLTELAHIAGRVGPQRVTSIFFGGGTPSLMPPETVGAVIDTAGTLWGLDPACEITLEANPTSSEAALFRDFRAAGVNRISIGVQSLEDAALNALGREHSADEARATIAMAARIFDRYSFDLIYARPDQTPDAWARELQAATALMGDHVSVYQLTIEPHTQFHTLYHSGRLILPPEDDAARFYDITQEILEGAGLPAYEISNHARMGQESRHNLTYWQYGAYAGIGPGAHGRVKFDGAYHATRTHRAPEMWLERVEAHGHGYEPFAAVDARTQFEEAFMMGLRLRDGVALDALSARIGFDVRNNLNQARIALYKQEGLLELRADSLVPTRAGRLVLTRLTGDLLA